MLCPPSKLTRFGVMMYLGDDGRIVNSTDAVSGFVMHNEVV